MVCRARMHDSRPWRFEVDCMSRVLPLEWLPAGANVARVVLHWTAGRWTPSLLDRAHYHLLLDGAGKPRRGIRPVGAKLPHTRGLNTGSVGLALCGMAGARQSPFDPGPWPIHERQWRLAARAAAEILQRYRLYDDPQDPPPARLVLSHCEVGAVYGVEQRGKWDVSVLPWERDLAEPLVHRAFRLEVQAALAALLRN